MELRRTEVLGRPVLCDVHRWQGATSEAFLSAGRGHRRMVQVASSNHIDLISKYIEITCLIVVLSSFLCRIKLDLRSKAASLEGHVKEP